MFFFGIDWGQKHHQLCIRSETGVLLSQVQFDHSVKGFQRLVKERQKLGAPPAECLVAIETAHNPLVDTLLSYGHPVYIVPPQATAAYRGQGRSSGAYDDVSDAALLADVLRINRDVHRPCRPNEPLTQCIHAQVRLIETLRRSIQRHSNQLRDTLIRCYPAALGLFSDLTTQINLHFLIAYPMAKEAEALTRETFGQFCREHGYTRTDQISDNFARLMEPVPQPSAAAIEAYQSHVQTLALILLPQVRQREQALSKLQKLFQQHPDAEIFASLPGAGELLAPALLAKFGDHRDRFPAPKHVQALAGTCPVTQRSGQWRRIFFRRGCDKEFRRIAQQFARSSVKQSGWAKAYWLEVRPRCKSDSHAYRVLANRWLAIIWKMWQSRQPYDETYHLKQRARRRSTKPVTT
jgi:transposase